MKSKIKNPSIVYRLSSIVYCLSTINYQLLAFSRFLCLCAFFNHQITKSPNHQIGSQQSAVSSQQSPIPYPLSTIYYLLSTVLYLCVFVSLFLTANAFSTQSNFQRIISLGPVITEQLYILNVENKLIANTTYCVRPLEAKKKPKIGSVTTSNIEKIISLKPDLILATSLSNPKQMEKLKNLKIKVVTFSYPKNFSQICQQFLAIGKLVGKEKKAKEMIKKIKKKVMLLQKQVKNSSHHSHPKVFIQIGTKPLFTVIKDSFMNDFIKFAGGINIAADAKTGLYSREKVITQNPDVIIIAAMGIVGEDEQKIWQKYKTLNAVKHNRIHIVDSYKFCSPNPITFVEALEKMVKILYTNTNKSEKKL